MRAIFSALAALLITFVALTLVPPGTLAGLALLYALSLYGLFFSARRAEALTFFIVSTVALELLVPSRFGLVSLLSFIAWSLSYLFVVHLRFTSLYLRYIVCLLLTYGAMIGFFGTDQLALHLLTLLAVAAGVGVATSLLRSANQETEYEFL